MESLTRPLNPDSPTASVGHIDVRIKGKEFLLPSADIDGRTVVTTGSWVRIGSIRHEELIEGDTIADPALFVTKLKNSNLKVDILTFAQRTPDSERKFNYRTEWENAAAIPITTFSQWFKERAEYSIRKAVNRAKKVGVTAKIVEFDDQFLHSACPIYNEVPVRQGKVFWHFGKDFETLKHELANYLDRSIFIGAYYQDELIGFIKMTRVGTTGTLTQILSMKKHFDKRPNNALIAKAVEVCEERGWSHLIYGNYVYYDPNSSLTDFKRRNGFESIPLPRYIIPLTTKGKIAAAFGVHRGIVGNTPKAFLRLYLKLRRLWVERKLKKAE